MKAKYFAKRDKFPINNNDFVPVLLSFEDYVRLRRLPLSDALNDELDRAIVVSVEQVPEDVVTMYARCAYRDGQSGVVREVELVYPDEADSALGRISVLSPVGSALLGLRAGQEIAWDFPDGSRRSLKVERVRRSASGFAERF